MKSQELIGKFRTFYERFFRDCDVVVSCPGVFFWAGEHAVLRGIPAVCQHVPLRVYVGLESTKLLHEGAEREICFSETSIDYRPEGGNFKERKLVERKDLRDRPTEILKTIRRICNRERFEENSFTIHVLNELPSGIGCNWSGAFSSALALGLLVLNGRVNEEDIARWQRTKVSELYCDENFDRCNRMAWEIETAFHGGSASGYGTFCSLASTGQPIVYFTVGRRDNDPDYPPIDLSSNPRMIYDRERLKYGGFSFVEKGWVSEDHEWPFLFGLISSGIEKSTAESIDFVRGERREALGEATSTILECIEEESGRRRVYGVELEKLPLFHLCYKEQERLSEVLQDSSYQSIAAMVAETFGNLKSLAACNKEEREKFQRRLAGALRGVEGGLCQLGLQWPEGALIASALSSLFVEHGIWERSAIKLVGGGQGGTLLFITPLEGRGNVSMRERIIECLQKLKEKYEILLSNLSLYWLSSDGFERDGARLEKPVETNDRFGTIAEVDESWEVIYCSPQGERILRKFHETGINKLSNSPEIIFLDELKEEIFIGGSIPNIIRKPVLYYLEYALLRTNPARRDDIKAYLNPMGKWSESWKWTKDLRQHLEGFETAVQQHFPESGFKIYLEYSSSRTFIQGITLEQGNVKIYIRTKLFSESAQ